MHSRHALITALVAATPSLALVQPRQASEDFSATLAALSTCEAALASAYSGVPTPPADILSWVVSEATAIEAAGSCVFPSPPASLSADLSSYTAAVDSWWTAHSAAVSSALSLCPVGSGGAVTSTPCTAYTALGGGGANTPTATAPPTSTGTGTTGQGTTTAGAPGSGTTGAGGSTGTTGAGAGGSSTTATKNLSPKETGRIVGALAAAGLIGVAAMIL